MRGHNGPRIVSDGLVLYYDMGNTRKSWKGAPVTNLFGTNLVATDSTRIGPNNKIYTGWKTTGVTNDNPRKYLFNSSLSISASTFYTLSCIYWSSSNQVDDVYLRFSDTGWTESTYYIQPFTGQSVTRNGSYSITDLGNGWKKCVGTFQTLSTTTTLTQLFFDNDTTGVDIFISEIQLEERNFATPFVAGTRSNTESLLDLTGNNTLTASSLTYNSNNTFSFSTSNLIVSQNNTQLDTNNPTIEVWVKPNTLTQNGFWFEKGTVNSQYSLFQEGSNICFRTKPSGSYDSLYGSSSVLSTSAWNHVVAVKTSTEKIIYVNGVKTYSNTHTDPITTTTGGMSIGVYGGYAGGRGYYYNGSIGIVKIYNRDLSALEVQQNFNALRGRFGI